MTFMKKGAAWFIFLLLLSAARPPLQSEVYYPWKDIYIGALEGDHWFGLILAVSKDAVFAFRLKVVKNGQNAEGNDFFYLISEVGPHSPDGQYSRIKADLSHQFKQGEQTPVLIKPSPRVDTLTLEWCRQDEKSVIGRIRAPKNILLQIEHHFPWDLEGRYRVLADGQVQGENEEGKKQYYLFWTDRKGESPGLEETVNSVLSYSMEEKRDLYFVAGVGNDRKTLSNQVYRYKNTKTIDAFLRDEEERYKSKRVKIDGLFKGAAEAITNNLFWMILYQPDEHRLYAPAARTSISGRPDGTMDYWTISGKNSFFSALEVSVESQRHVREIIRAVLETQYPNGNIPEWRGRFGGTPDRSHPPIGSFVVLKLFGRSGDRELLKTAYPYLKRWHAFWKSPGPGGLPRRDGNGDGLLEWGSDGDLAAASLPLREENASGKQRAMRESSQDDLPNWEEASFDEETGTLTMNCVDLNSLYALDAYCLAQMADFLDLPEEYSFYLQEYEEMKALINRLLWNEREGFFFDRHWNGRFSPRKAASNFYPLLARIPDEKRALRMIRRLLNPKEFWGDYVVPTISRDDPLFKEQQRWRGTISPATNYLVYQGLKAFGFDAVATEFASKSSDLFLRSWENFQLCPENFDSRTGEAGGGRYQSGGPLFALIALEEYMDFTPWEGFRFGILSPEQKGTLSRFSIQGRHYQVDVSSSRVKLTEEEKEIIKADGSCVFRRFLYSENEVSFEFKSLKKREVEVKFLKKAKYQLLVDGQLRRVFKGRSLKFDLTEGDHTVLIQLLEEQD